MSEYMQGGALASDDLDFSASSDRGRASEHASTAVKSPALNVAIGVSAVVMVVGLVLWFMQLSGGMVQTAMRNLDSWGLYITGFMFFVGLSAGGLIISSVPKALGIRGFGGISKVAVFSSIACTVVAIGLVVVDMGQPFRVWELFVYSNLGSPLMWDIIVLSTYLILSCVYLWAQIPGRARQGQRCGLARHLGDRSRYRRARPFGNCLDLQSSAGARDVAYSPSGSLVRVLRSGVWYGARDGCCHWIAPCRLPQRGARQHRASRQAARSLCAGGFVLLWL